MLYTCWAAKGGSGTTVVAALLALALAHDRTDVLLIDAGGDLPATLGMAPVAGPGLAEWLAAGDAPADALGRLEVPVAAGLTLVPRGSGPVCGGERLQLLEALLRADGRSVVIDAGRVPASAEGIAASAASSLAAAADRSLLVIRPCYLALQRALAVDVRPTGVVVVDEDGRSLDEGDVEQVLGVAVVAVVPVEPSLARSVDAGLLATRAPRRARRALRGAA